MSLEEEIKAKIETLQSHLKELQQSKGKIYEIESAGSLLRQPSLEACINECKSIGIKKEYCPCNRLFQN